MEKYQRDITLEEYKLSVQNQFPDYLNLLEQIDGENVGQDMLQDLLRQSIERSQAYDLALLSIDVSEGRQPLSKILDFYSKLEDQIEKDNEEEFVTDDIRILFDETIHKPGLRWRLNTLNQSLGSLRKGDFGFIFARPETGKTTFLASEITHFASQTDAPILWFNNEEGGNKVKVRIMQAAIGINQRDLFKDMDLNFDKYIGLTNGNIKLKDSASIHKRQIELLCNELKPALIIFDQIDKIKGFDADREDLRLGAIYIWARELAKQYCPVIGVCQADVTAEGKKWLTMDNVANAKTSKQAEADWILGIGTVHDEALKYVRYLHLSKNKLSGDEDTSPELRHGKLECLILPEIARYRDYQ
jgi:replicative DNA helicase